MNSSGSLCARVSVESRISELLDEQQINQAVEEILEFYGPRIFRMMMGVFHNEAIAQDVYQQFSIQLWESLESFRGDSQIYTWTYTLARRAIGQRLRGSKKETRLHTHQRDQLAAKWTRTATAEWRKTESKDKFQEMVEELDHDERTLVMLRIGEEMSWKEVAQVMQDGDETLEGSELSKESGRLRKKFQRVKDKLKRKLG